MTRDDIIRMAKEAGLPRWYQTDEVVNIDLLSRFADLVAAAEREECAKVCEAHANIHRENRQFVYAAANDKCVYAIRARGDK
jgi:uncharacterized protein (DUF924 family)